MIQQLTTISSTKRILNYSKLPNINPKKKDYDELDKIDTLSAGEIVLDEDLDFISDFSFVSELGIDLLSLLLLSFLLDLDSGLCLFLPLI